MTTPVCLDPRDALIDRTTTQTAAQLRDAEGDLVMSFPAALTDEKIMHLLAGINRLYAKAYRLGQEAKARELRAVLGVAAADNEDTLGRFG